MRQSKRIYQEEQEWDAWSHFEEEGSFEPIKSKSKKIKHALMSYF